MTARANWTQGAMEFDYAPGNMPTAKYQLRGYVQHRHGDVSPSKGMQSGHYVAYLCKHLPARRGSRLHVLHLLRRRAAPWRAV